MRKYANFGAWILKQVHRSDEFGRVARIIAALNDPVIATKNRDDLHIYLRDSHHIDEDVLWFIDFDMFYDGWTDEAGWHAQNGFVYLLVVGSYHKIGITQKNVEHRIAALQTANPEPITLASHFLVNGIGDSVLRWEKYFHRRFSSKRRSGEWFLLSPADVDHFSFISQYYDYLNQNLPDAALSIEAVDAVIREVAETNKRNAGLVGKRVFVPKGTAVVSKQCEPLAYGLIGRVIDWSADPFWPSICVRNKGKDYWFDSKNIHITP